MSKPGSIKTLLGEFLPDAQAIENRDAPRLHHITLYSLLALIVTAILWAVFSHIDKVVMTRGRLVTPMPNIVVQPLQPGILKSLEVRVGQVVRKGDVLATLDATFAGADVAQLGVRSNSLSLRADRLETEINGAPKYTDNIKSQDHVQHKLLIERRANYAARLKQFDENLHRLRASLDTNAQDFNTLSTQVQTLRELENMHVEMHAKQFGSRAKLLEVQAQRQEVERDMILARNREKEILSEIRATEAERIAFAKSWRQQALEELSNTLQQRDEVSEQLAKARRLAQLVELTSPENAIVLDIGKKSVGSVVQDAEALFVLVPINAELEAEVEVDPADIGEIRVDDAVRIKLDAYPFQKHGTLNGQVISVSADAFSRQSGVTGASMFHYLARVRLATHELNNVSTPTILLPGMTLSGEIITGKRSVISYFAYPIIRTLDESLRER